MKALIILAIVLVTAQACTKGWEDIQKDATMYRVSERYTLDWKKEGSPVNQQVAYNYDLINIRDTTFFPATCPDPHIEIRYYKIVY